MTPEYYGRAWRKRHGFDEKTFPYSEYHYKYAVNRPFIQKNKKNAPYGVVIRFKGRGVNDRWHWFRSENARSGYTRNLFKNPNVVWFQRMGVNPSRPIKRGFNQGNLF